MPRRRPPQGFTFYELALILIVLTVVLMVATSTAFHGQIGDNARAQALWEASARLAQGWKYVTMQCGVSDRTQDNPMLLRPAGGSLRANPIDALYFGPDPANSANLLIEDQYRGCWRASGVKHFQDLLSVQPDPVTAVPTLMAFGEHPIRMSGGNGLPLAVELENIPEGMWLHFLHTHGDPSVTSYDQPDTTSKTVRYRQLENGQFQVTLLFPY